MDNASAKELLKRYKDGKCTPEELAWLESWYLSLNSDAEPLDADLLETATRRLEERLLETTSRKQTSKNRSWLRYAAAAVLVISGGLFFLIKEKGNGGYEPVQAVILPGGNKATLARDDGLSVELSAHKAGIVVGDEITYEDGT